MSFDEFWDENGKVLVGVLGGFVLIAFIAFTGRGCNRDDDVAKVQESAHRAEVQKECLRTGHTALECKELR